MMRHPAFPASLACFLALGLAAGGCTPVGVAAGAGAVGVTAAQTEKGFRRSMSDTEIRIAINDLWLRSDEEMFRKVNLQVQEGRVLLSGNVRLPEQRVEAVRLVWQVPGVREVINEVTVDDTSGLGDLARDTWVSAQLRSTLLFDKDVSAIDYSIETVNQVIYLMGVAQDQAELDRVIGHAKDISYVRRVVSYVLLKNDPARTS
jgi:osmotically-inducible protein OsmY